MFTTKKLVLLKLFCLLHTGTLFSQQTKAEFVTYDIDNFWTAFDKIKTTKDSVQQYQYLDDIFLSKGSPGLKDIMQARRYTAKSYIDLINSYPLFWQSIRKNTLTAKNVSKKIEVAVTKLKVLYPELKPASIYFTVGAFRTPGTAMNGAVLIGSEMAMGDANTVTTEFPKSLDFFKTYLKANPIKEIAFLNVHEYVHTQQKTDGGYDLLSQSLFEGIAEYVSVVACGQPSPAPAIPYGKINDKKIKAVFEKEMFSPWYYNWIWNNMENEFKTRDLGYYMGYAIAEKYYVKTKDKKQAIKTLIQLDYNNREAIESFIENSSYFATPLKTLKEAYEKSRPTVVNIKEFKNGEQNIRPGETEVTVVFSTKMDKRFSATDFGPLGKNNFPEIISAAFAEDAMSFTYKIRVEPGKRYQFYIWEGFRTERAIPLVNYLVDFYTSTY